MVTTDEDASSFLRRLRDCGGGNSKMLFSISWVSVVDCDDKMVAMIVLILMTTTMMMTRE